MKLYTYVPEVQTIYPDLFYPGGIPQNGYYKT